MTGATNGFGLDVLTLVILSLALVTAAGVIVRLKRRVDCLEQQQEAALKGLQDDIKALFDSSVGVGEGLRALERRFKHLEERQDQLDLKDPGYHAYAQAIRLVQNGADVEQITATCGLSRGEAELIRLLHHMENHDQNAV